jgi:endoglucanase Acf2
MRSPLPTNRPRRLAGARATRIAIGFCAALIAGHAAAGGDTLERHGAGGVLARPIAADLGFDTPPPAPTYRIGAAAAQAVPTNQWYSTTVFHRWAYPLYAQPMSYRPTEAGFEVGLPKKVVAIEDDGRKRFIRYPHVPALTVGATAYHPTHSALSAHGDWLVTLRLADEAGRGLDATVLHGSPYSYYAVDAGDLSFHGQTTTEIVGGTDGPSVVLRIAGQLFAIYAPHGARFEHTGPTDLVLHLNDGARYAVVAGLPDERPETLALFAQHAYALPTDTRVSWHYDEAHGTVESTYAVMTRTLEGPETTTLMGLYPHQWSATDVAPASSPTYASVRGPIRVIAANAFTLRRPFNGILPRWGEIRDPQARAQVDALLNGDVAKADQLFMKQGHGTYWIGKGLGAVSQLVGIAEAEGRLKQRDELIDTLKARLETWFDGRHPQHYTYDASYGALFGFPQEYGSVTQINDHHFHYGYWLQAAAAIGLRDPAWLGDDRWGPMVRELVADIATTERGRHDFPFLRNFDPYEGHSWASGTQASDLGNNQESSSEAVNAWAGLIFLGAAMHDTAMRDLGIYLYTSEVASVQQYWFDLPRNVLAPELGSPFASMVFGSQYGYNTWWTEEPRQIMGINLLPITTASTYLGRDPQSVRRGFAALPGEVKAYQTRGITDGTPPDIWQDVMAEYLALVDPAAAFKSWDRRSYVEIGDTRTHTLYWIESLAEIGQPDFTVSADSALAAAFVKDGVRTHLAYNTDAVPQTVHFSDGATLDVPPHSLGRDH